MKLKGFILFAILGNTAFAQQVFDVEKHWVNVSPDVHTEVKSFAFFQLDSLTNKDASQISLSAAPDIAGAYQGDRMAWRTGANLVLKANLKEKLGLMADYRFGYANQRPVPYQSLLQAKSYFTTSLKDEHFLYHDLRGRIAYNPNKYIQLQAGLDHLFIGEGDRSLLLGNQGIPNPFAQLRAKLWKLEYYFIQQIWREGRSNHFSPKGNASHYLTFKADKHWSIGIFESVVYSMKDTLYNRGFEVEYLNPLIFFRPQEYSVGSTDNVLIGINTAYQWKKNMFYAQVIIDDFFLAEIRARNRWWANKFGFQIGYKGWSDQGENQYFYRTEFNLVRPFTYSQVNVDNVFGNQALAVSHPLGSNFVEIYQEVAVQRNSWKIQVWAQAYLKGLDSLTGNTSFGGDIYRSYNNRPEEYNFTIGRGETYRALQLGVNVGRRVLNDNIQVFAEPRYIVSRLEGKTAHNFFFTAGISRAIGADRRNY